MIALGPYLAEPFQTSHSHPWIESLAIQNSFFSVSNGTNAKLRPPPKLKVEQLSSWWFQPI